MPARQARGTPRRIRCEVCFQVSGPPSSLIQKQEQMLFSPIFASRDATTAAPEPLHCEQSALATRTTTQRSHSPPAESAQRPKVPVARPLLGPGIECSAKEERVCDKPPYYRAVPARFLFLFRDVDTRERRREGECVLSLLTQLLQRQSAALLSYHTLIACSCRERSGCVTRTGRAAGRSLSKSGGYVTRSIMLRNPHTR